MMSTDFDPLSSVIQHAPDKLDKNDNTNSLSTKTVDLESLKDDANTESTVTEKNEVANIINPYEEFITNFNSENITNRNSILSNLQKKAFAGKLVENECLRAISWRLFFGIFKGVSCSDWVLEMEQLKKDYNSLQRLMNPTIDHLKADPLSGLISEGSDTGNEEWTRYYLKLETASMIGIDLDRLYMQGLDDSYFQSYSFRKERLLNILLVWSLKNHKVGYRQGMHEIAATISYVLDVEQSNIREYFPSDHVMHSIVDEKYFEASLFSIYDRVLTEMLPLYDPVPIPNGSVQIVDYCTRIQEHFLRQIDPELCEKLEDSYIQGQIYGLRWARLLLGREFSLAHNQSLRIWDYMFAACIQPNTKENQVLVELPSAQCSVSAAALLLKERYGNYSLLMGVLGDFMLAMLLHIREQLISGDSNDVLGLLMKYPKVESIKPIMELADMIRRGVMNTGAHLGANSSKYVSSQAQMQGNFRGSGSQSGIYVNPDLVNKTPVKPSPPAWLLTNPILPVINNSTINDMSKKMSEQINSAVTSVRAHSLQRKKMQESELEKESAKKESIEEVDPSILDPLGLSVASEVKVKAPSTIKSPISSPRQTNLNTGSQIKDNWSWNKMSDTPLFQKIQGIGNINPKDTKPVIDLNVIQSRLLDISTLLLSENDVNTDDSIAKVAAMKIKLLANVLSGTLSINDYDATNNSNSNDNTENKLDSVPVAKGEEVRVDDV